MSVQLSQKLDDYRRALTATDPGKLTDADPGSLFRRVIVDPLRTIRDSNSTVLLVVDGLDEAVTVGEANIARLLRDRADDLPSWVRLVVSTRKDPNVLDLFGRVSVREIEVDRPDNLRDLAGYLQVASRDAVWIEALSRTGADPQAVTDAIHERAAGNFLYARQTVDAIRVGEIDPRYPDRFPAGLAGIYQRFFEQVFPTPDSYVTFRPILDVLCASRGPVTVSHLANVLSRDPFDVESDLQRIAVLFPETNGVYRPCHKSLTDWLCGRTGKSKTYRVNIIAGHQKIAERLLVQFRAQDRSAFVVTHLPAHLTAGGLWTQLESLLTDLDFIEAKCAAGLAFSLIADYEAGLAAWPGHQRYDPFGTTPDPIPTWIRESTAAALMKLPDPNPTRGSGPILTALRAVLDSERDRNVPDVQVADHTEDTVEHRSTQRHSKADVGEELLEGMRRAEAASRAGKDPFAASTPAARVAAFAEFVTTHGHFLAQNPTEVMPLAFNAAKAGLVAERAEQSIFKVTRTWVVRESRPPAPASRPACLRVLKGHTASVLTVALTADGRRAVSAGADHTLRVWNVASGECIATLTGHTAPVNAVAVTPDGRLAISGSNDGTVRVWTLDQAEGHRKLEGHFGAVYSVAVTPDGSLAVTGGRDRAVRVWDVRTGSTRWMSGHIGSVIGISITADGKLAVSTDMAGILRVWDVAAGRCLRVLRGHTLPVKAVAISPDGSLVITGGNGKTLRVWDLVAGEPITTMTGHKDSVLGVALAANRVAASVGKDRSLRIWDIQAGKPLRVLPAGTAHDVCMTPDGRLAATAEADNVVRIWDIASGIATPPSPGHASPVNGFAWTPDGQVAVSASRDETLRLWDSVTGRCVRVLRGHSSWVHGVAVTPDGRRVVSSGWDATVRVWDFVTGLCAAVLEGHTGEVAGVAVSSDGNLAASGSFDHTIRLWDLGPDRFGKSQTGEPFDGPTGGRCVATFDQRVCLASVAFSPDGRLLAAGDWDGSIALWPLGSSAPGQVAVPLHSFSGHESWVTTLDFSQQGDHFASGSRDGTVRVWDHRKRACLRVLRGHTTEVFAVRFTSDGRYVLSGGADGTVRVWQASTGKSVAVYFAGDVVRSISEVQPSGRFACGTQSGQLHALCLRNFQ